MIRNSITWRIFSASGSHPGTTHPIPLIIISHLEIQSATGIQGLESKDVPKHPTMHRTAPSQPGMSTVPRLRNPTLGFVLRRQWHPTPVLLPRKSHGQRSLVGCSPWSHEELDRTEQLHFHFSLSSTGEGNGNPLQYACLENPRDGSLVGRCLWGRTKSDTTDVT